MVQSGKTTDLDIYIGADTWLQKMTQLLSGSIDGTVASTYEQVIGSVDDELTVHGVGTSATLSTVYDSAETDVLAQHITDSSPTWLMVHAGAPESVEFIPFGLQSFPTSAPPADAISRTLTMPASGRSYWSTNVTAVSVDSSTRHVDLGTNVPVVGDYFLVITEKSSTFALALDASGTTQTQSLTTAEAAVGIHKIVLDATDFTTDPVATLQLDCGANANTLSGFWIVATPQHIPTG